MSAHPNASAPAQPLGSPNTTATEDPSSKADHVFDGRSPPAARAGFRRYALGLLLAIFALNFFDRQIINILAEQIRHELRLADWQIGVMTGFAFAIFNAIFGLPLAYQSDRRHRPYILAGCVAAWSAFTALCGVARGFSHLVIARFGVGAAESGCTPVAQSLICDYAPREKRASALAVYHLGVPLGSLLGMAAGGILADSYGWRQAFFIAAAPGFAFAVIAALTLREPRQQGRSSAVTAAANISSFRETLAFVRRKRSFWLVNFGAAIKAFVSYGQAPFLAAFFLRVHKDELATLAAPFHLQATGFLGVALGLLTGISMGLGIWAGGQLADRQAARDPRAYCSIPAWASLAMTPFAVAAVWAPNVPVAFLLLAVSSFLGALWFGPCHTVETSVVKPHMRATASAIQTLMLNLIGLGLGPLTVGLISDYVGNQLGLGRGEGVRWALTASSFITIPTFALFWMARKTIREDLE